MRRVGKKSPTVYVIGPEEYGVGRVKVGFSIRHPSTRLSIFNTGSPYRLRIYAYFDGSQIDEMRLHRALAGLRVHGEWFHVADGFERFLSEICAYDNHQPVPSAVVHDAAIRHMLNGGLPKGEFMWGDGEGIGTWHDPDMHLQAWLYSKGAL